MSQYVELAKALGVDERTIRRWRSRPDWPFGETGPYVAADVAAWRDVAIAPKGGADEIDDQIKRAKLARAVHDARSAKVAADLAEKRVYDAEEVTQDTLRHLYAARNAMLSIGHEAAFELRRQAGVAPEITERIIREITRRILTDMASNWSYRVPGTDKLIESFDAAPTCANCHLSHLAAVPGAHAEPVA